MKRVSEKTMKALLGINCAYNHKPESNGRCYSTKCMLNGDRLISSDIKINGCRVYANMPEAIEEIKKLNDRP